jgi:hypothetical protein
MDNIHSAPLMMEDVKSEAPTASDRLKASNFPAKFLKIGNWEVRKFYYYGLSSIWKLSISVAYRKKNMLMCSTRHSMKVIWWQNAIMQSRSLFGKFCIVVLRVR